MQKFMGFFTPDPGQIAGLGAVLLVCIGLVSLGAVAGARKRLYETDLIAGWALVSAAFVAAGGLFRLPFSLIGIALLAAAVAGAVYVLIRDRFRIPGDIPRAVALALPAVWLAACMTISQWDEFTQWIPNARYIFTEDGFPGEGMPTSFSAFPAYPHGLAFVTYLSSHLAGHLVENATGIFNVILLALFGVTVGRTIRKAVTRPDPQKKVPLGLAAMPPESLGWTYCALGGLAVTALNPTFVPKIVFTAYADTATAVLVGLLTAMTWMLLNTLAGEDKEFSARHLAWRIGLVAMALVAVKQVNLVLFLLVAGSGTVVALRDPAVSFVRFARVMLPALLLPVAMYLLWRFHIQLNDVSGEFAITPADRWLTDKIGVIAERMALIASKKGGYFGVMLIAVVFAARALWRVRTPFDRLSLIVGGAFVGYTLFLLFAYVTAFGAGEALRAASYWRYNMHLGGACMVFAAFGAALLWRRWATLRIRRNFGWAAIVLMVAAPIVAAEKIRFDSRPAKIYVRATAEDIAATLPDGSRIAILDVGGNGAFGVIARYALSERHVVVGQMTAASQPVEKNILTFIRDSRPDYIWVHFPTGEVERALLTPLEAGASHLVHRTGEGWRTVRSWPYPGYDDPYVLPD